MEWLTPKDGDDLRLAAISLVVIMLVAPLISVFFRWRRKQPLFAIPKWQDLLGSSWIILFIILMGPVGDIAKRHGWSKDAIFVVSLLLLGAFVLLSLFGHVRNTGKLADANGVANPAAGVAAKVPQSVEEKRLTRKLWIAVALFALLPVGLMLALPSVIGPPAPHAVHHGSGLFPGITGLLVMFVLTGMLLFTMAYALIGRWPGSYAKSASIEIAATPEQIWEKLAYHDGMKNWRGIHSRIERLPGPDEAFRLHYLTSENCAQCGLAKVPESEAVSSRIEVLAAREPHFYSIRSFPKGETEMKGEASGWMDCEQQDFTITALPVGGSRVTSESRVERPKIWLFLMIRFGSPVSQLLESLKAHLEGKPDQTIYGTQVARIAAARLAPRFCGCASSGQADALPA
jgi:hypothetical protein